MKIKKYTNGAWADLDKPVKKFGTYTDEATTLPLTIEASATDAIENYRIYGTSEGAGVETENLFDAEVERGSFNPNTGVPEDVPYRVRTTFSSNPLPAGTYTISVLGASSVVVYAYTSESTDDYSRSASQTSWQSLPYTFTTSNPLFLRFAFSSGKTIVPSDVSNIMIIPGSIAPASYIPPGYKIPILNTSGVTENLWDIDSWNSATVQRGTIERIGKSFKITATGNDAYTKTYADSIYAYEVTSNEQYTLSWKVDYTSTFKGQVFVFTGENDGNMSLTSTTASAQSVTFTIPNNHHYLSFRLGVAYSGDTLTYSDIMIVKGSTAPDHYIPHRYESNYDLFIGDSKLGKEEYLDYQEQKIYKMISGVLTPVDLPAPLPPIPTYKGENALSSTETLGEVTVKYEGWKGVGDVEKYQNSEWSDNNGT